MFHYGTSILCPCTLFLQFSVDDVFLSIVCNAIPGFYRVESVIEYYIDILYCTSIEVCGIVNGV